MIDNPNTDDRDVELVCAFKTPLDDENNPTPIGFAVWNSNGIGVFGPTGVIESERGKGIGKAILIRAMYDMRYHGFKYAIIGGVGRKVQGFYEKAIGAKPC